MVSRTLLGAALAALVVLAGIAAVPAAERRAVAAEERHLADRLAGAQCLDDWGVDEGAATGGSAVTGVTPAGVRVAVTVPYAYRIDGEGEPVFADAAAEAEYVVTPFGARRVRGDDVDPC